ncbi:LacI family DNA-binding transcriptional regulator [uncultured Propionibacterium sp.]|uniref:LacI family DNA-binding transcriptional regulator n=1 Tax=uncultured Propionibacterium sp. TaxID=218066 RepID=UPI00292CB568|nr:LacI family DNA-binding transcriptional regulator [uncultured Propionibacterium sp.]
MNHKVTSYDVALAAGVSRSAVSLVLNGKADGVISAENQRAVREAAERLGYRPNRVARSLRDSRTHLLGVVTDVTSGPYGGGMITGATIRAAESDHLLLVMDAQECRHDEERAIEALLARQVDGLIVAPGSLREWTPPKAFGQVPGVLLDATDPDGRATCVVGDETGGGYAATRLLLDAGHRDIALLTGLPAQVATGRRLAGHERAMRGSGGRCRVVTCGWDIDDGLREGARLLDGPDRPTGIVCANDRVAAGVILAAARLGIDVPDGLSVVGYDDDPSIAAQLDLSTIGLPHRAMGERAVELLLSAISGGQLEPGELLVPAPVLRRGSVRMV